MTFVPITYLAVLLAAGASFVVTALWYGLPGRQWMLALGWSSAEIAATRKMPTGPLLTAFLAELLMAFVLRGVLGHLGPGTTTLRNGLISGLFIWGGFVVTSLVVDNAFARRKLLLTLIGAGHWLAVLLVQGAILGAMG